MEQIYVARPTLAVLAPARFAVYADHRARPTNSYDRNPPSSYSHSVAYVAPSSHNMYTKCVRVYVQQKKEHHAVHQRFDEAIASGQVCHRIGSSGRL